MRILVTGAGGFVGKRLTQALSQQGHKVVALLRTEPAEENRRYFAGANTSIFKADLESLDCADLPGGVDAVYTLAQSAVFRDFPAKAGEIYAVNVTANLRLLQWARQKAVARFIHVSSGGIYGGRPGAHFQETDLLAVDSPLGFYLGTKLCSEVIFQNYRHFFSTAVILRPFFIYGPGQRKDMFVARIIDNVQTGKPISLQGRDGLKINPVYVDDAVGALVRALDVSGCQIFNVAGPDVVSLRELSELIGKKTGRAPVFEISANAQPVDYVGTTTRASRILGSPVTSLDRGISLALGG